MSAAILGLNRRLGTENTLPRRPRKALLAFPGGNRCRSCHRRFRTAKLRRRHERRVHEGPTAPISGAEDVLRDRVRRPAPSSRGRLGMRRRTPRP